MANRKTDDAQNRYDDLILDTIRGIDSKVDRLGDNLATNTSKTTELAEKVKRLERKVFNGTAPPTPSIFKDPTVQKVILYIIFGAVAIVATLKGVHLPTP